MSHLTLTTQNQKLRFRKGNLIYAKVRNRPLPILFSNPRELVQKSFKCNKYITFFRADIYTVKLCKANVDRGYQEYYLN